MIHKKLLIFQQAGVTIKKGAVNPFFTSTYANLNEVLDKVKPVLNEMAVVIIQTPTATGLTTTLYDTEDDTFVESFLPFVEMTNPQKVGSNITYNRRYALVTMLGLEDEDDDGNKASGTKAPVATSQRGNPAPVSRFDI